MNILMIGGTRFMGPLAVDMLTKQKHRIFLMHRNPPQNPSGNAVHIKGDCNRPEDLKKAVKQADPDTVVHMFAYTEKHIKALEESLGGKTRRLILISSGDVYKAYGILTGLSQEPVLDGTISEQSPLREKLYPWRGVADSPYAFDYDKILVERAAFASPLLDTVVLRPDMVYGEKDPNRRFSHLVRSMGAQDTSIEFTETEAAFRCSRSYSADTAWAIVLAAEKAQAGEIYNIAQEKAYSELEWAEKIARMMNWKGRFKIVPDSRRAPAAENLRQHLITDSGKIRRELGYREPLSLEEGLRRTVEWEKTQLSL